MHSFRMGAVAVAARLAVASTPVGAWSPTWVSTPLELSLSNRRVTLPTGNTSVAKTVRGDKAITSGKWYWEVSAVDVINGSTTTSGVGIVDSSHESASRNLAAETTAESVGWWCSGNVYRGGSVALTSSTWGDGDKLMFAFDYATGKLWLGKNGTWTGDPAAGTGQALTLSTSATYYPAACPWSSSGETVVLDLLGTPTYTVPSGFTHYAATPSSPITFTPMSNVTLTNSNQTAESTSGWNTCPLSGAIPSTGKTYIEFDLTTTSQHMIGVMVGNTPVVGNYLGAVPNQVSNGDQLRNGGGAFTTSVAGDLNSGGWLFGVAIDQTTGKIRWYRGGVLQSAEVSFTPGTAGLYFAVGLFNGRGAPTVLQSSTNTPSGYTYHVG